MWRTAFAVALTATCTVAIATPVADVISDSGGVGNGCQFAGDHMLLTIWDGKQVVTTFPFCSSYGRAHATIEKDAKGAYYVLLWSSEGHGTRAAAEYLTVFLLRPVLDEYVRTPVSGAASADTDWEYHVHVEKPEAGGLRISLARSISGRDAEWYPEPAMRQVFIGTR